MIIKTKKLITNSYKISITKENDIFSYTDKKGNKFWYILINGRKIFHGEDNPAIEWKDGTEEWYYYGKRHRDNGPAIIKANGTKEWYYYGKLHCLDGPAIEYADGTKEWWINGKRHRINGPAIEKINGTKIWWVNDKLHRINGPAVEWNNGTTEWWVNGKQLPIKEVEKWIINNNLNLSTKEGQIAFKMKWF